MPATYGTALYGTSVYGSSGKSLTAADAAALGFTDATLTARPTDFNQVQLDWRNPTAPHVKRVLVRSPNGFPPDPTSPQSVILMTVDDASGTTDPNIALSSLQDTVAPGSEVFYTLFVLVAEGSRTTVVVDGGSNTSAYLWLPVAQASCVTSIDHGSLERLRSAIPSAFLAVNGAEIAGPVDESTITKVYRGMAEIEDQILTNIDRVLAMWNLAKTPAPLVDSLSATLGMRLEPALGPKPQRTLAANAIRLYNRKGTPFGLGLLAECASGVDTTVERGVNLFPSVEASGHEQSITLTTRLAKAVAVNDTTITVEDVSGWPIQFTSTGALLSPFWVVIRSASGVEPMLVTSVSGTVLTVDRGTSTYGRFGFPQLSHVAASDVRTEITWGGWSAGPGYETRILKAGDTGFSMPTTAITEDAPLVASCTEISSATSLSVPAARLAYSPLRYVANYVRDGQVGKVTTRRPHGLVQGQVVTAMFGNASAVANTAANYSVASVQDPFTFTVQHTEPGLSDTTLTAADLAAATPPYVFGLPHPGTMLPAVETVQYVYSAYVRAASTTRTVQASITWYDATGNQVGPPVTGTGVTDSSTVWNRVSVTAVCPNGAVLAAVALTWTATWAADEVHYVAQHQFERGASPTPYDDGSLIKVGFNSQADIDPVKVIRNRTRELMKEIGAERRYRVQFLNRSIDLPASGDYIETTPSTNNTGDVLWQNQSFEVHMRLSLDALSGDQDVLIAQNAAGDRYWKVVIGATQLKFVYNIGSTLGTVLTVTGSAHGLSAGSKAWIRVTRNSTTGDIAFYKAVDQQSTPESWSAIGTGSTTFNGSAPATTRLTLKGVGNIYMARVLNGATILAEMDPFKFDGYRDRIPNGGFVGGPDWSLSTDATVDTAFP